MTFPAPLTPPNCDLRDFQFMPLDVMRLRDSGLAIEATDAEFRSAVMLWCAAWHQVPAGSLPDDDRALSHFAGFGRAINEWEKVREGALRGFVKCSDGRLYHPVIAEKAVEAWERKQVEFQRKKADRERKAAKVPRENDLFPPESDDGSGKNPAENALKGQGQGQGESTSPKVPSEGDDSADHDFEAFYQAYPRHVGKKAAQKAYKAAHKKHGAKFLLQEAQKAAQRYHKSDPQFIPHPATWLNGERWADEDHKPPAPEETERWAI